MNLDKSLIDRYLKGECTKEEIKFVENTISNLEDFEFYFPSEEWKQEIFDDRNHSDQEESLQKIYLEIHKSKSLRRSKIITYATIAATATLIGFGILYNIRNTELSHQIKNPTTQKIEEVEIGNLVHINSTNQNITIYTSDSSKITLSPGSEIKFAEDFRSLKERIINLKGEAIFQVTKNKEKPFRVLSKNIVTTALGTTFKVSEDANHKTKIELFEGKISIQSNKIDLKKLTKEIINAGQVVIKNNDLTILKDLKPNIYNKHRDSYYLQENNTISFKNMALIDVFNILENNYNIKISLSNNDINHKYYSGTFNLKDDIHADIIKEINYLHKINISFTK